MVSGCGLGRNRQRNGHRTVRRGRTSAPRAKSGHQQGKKQQAKDCGCIPGVQSGHKFHRQALLFPEWPPGNGRLENWMKELLRLLADIEQDADAGQHYEQ